MVVDSDNVPIAFALVIGAGASTAIGASVVFFPSLVKLASRKTLAGGLGLSAGVMTYVSFAEIFQKSIVAFEDSGYEYNKAYLYATLCFFGGVILMVMLNMLVHNLLGYRHSAPHEGMPASTQDVSGSEVVVDQVEVDAALAACACCDSDPGAQLDRVQNMAEEMELRDANEAEAEADDGVPSAPGSTNDDDDDDDEQKEPETQEEKRARISKAENKKLSRMSMNTAVAIALHNFPEGLATFVAALEDPKVGALLAVAIAIHNIPEGLCVAMPVYYATGNRWRAFWWAVFSGVSEPVAAVFGYIILASSFSNTMYAVLFGIVAGMMVIISVRELLPTAHRYDTEDSVVTFCFIGGMGIMAVSLVLFLL